MEDNEVFFLEDFYRQIQLALTLDQNEEPPVTIISNQRRRYDLQWRHPVFQKDTNYITIEEARNEILSSLYKYWDDDSVNSVLLVRASPGLGKTTAAIRFLQSIAKQGHSSFYLTPRHSFWDEALASSSFFDSKLWYHWQAINGQTTDNEPMCRYANFVNVWAQKGNPIIKACLPLCGETKDNHIHRCPYRKQNEIDTPIIAGVHQHLALGIYAKTKPEILFVDENPLAAMLDPKFIPVNFLHLGGGNLVQKLSEQLTYLCQTAPHNGWTSTEALNLLSPTITEIEDKIAAGTIDKSIMSESSNITVASDVYKARYQYFYDAFKLLVLENKAYKSGRTAIQRVRYSRDGLTLLMRNAIWDDAPDKIVILDGTGNPDLYEQLLGRHVTVVDPNVKPLGRIFQITNRLNGQSIVLEERKDNDEQRKLTQYGQELLQTALLIKKSKPVNGVFKTYNNPGVITFKDAVPYFKQHFGNNVSHFGGNRGSNSLEDCDCIIVCGTPSPPEDSILDYCTMLTFNPEELGLSRIQPFVEKGLSPRTDKEMPFRYIDEETGLMPFRTVSGFWDFPQIEAVHQAYREQELIQALHRGRSVVSECDVWILSSIPLGLWVDNVTDKPATILNMPDNATNWNTFYLLEQWLSNKAKGVYALKQIEKDLSKSRTWVRKNADALCEWKPSRYELTTINVGVGRPSIGLLIK